EEFGQQDMVAHQEVAITLSARGYVKRLPLSTYRAQHRGGRGITGMRTREDDTVRHLLVADTHDNIIFFTDRGRCFQVRAYELPDESRQARGTPLINHISLDERERVTAVVRCPPVPEDDFFVMATRLGEVKKTPLKDFGSVRRGGLIAMDLEPQDELVAAKPARADDQMILVTAKGKSLRFRIKALRAASRQSGGVRGIRLAKGDAVVGMEIVVPKEALLVVTGLGHGKRTPMTDYPTQGRGGQGVITFKPNPKTGDMVAARRVKASHELMLVSEEGIVLRTPVEHISLQGRPTQGVKLMNIGEGDAVAAITVIEMQKGRRAPAAPLPTGGTLRPREPRATARGRAAKGKAAPARPKATAKAPSASAKARGTKAAPPKASKAGAPAGKPPKSSAARSAPRPTARSQPVAKLTPQPKVPPKPPDRGRKGK
ncbi:MAG: hypothetical protein HYS09_10640, partial [Chloroflexi bacterium]|nr:hypothetical protein [Chloroflexota bacterium]